ncbi:MAG: NnrU family protein [Pseudomonadota bacterium]
MFSQLGWAEFAFAFALFFLSHSLPLRPAVKGPLVARVGPAGFGIGYSILSLAVLIWLVGAAGRAPYVQIWGWASWQNWFALASMALVCLILSFGLLRPNPLSFGGARNDQFDPDRPGIVRLVRHPVLGALGLWALAHIPANGNLAHVVLFGLFAVFALAGGRLVDRRKRRDMGDEKWTTIVSQIAQASPMAGWGTPLEIVVRAGVAGVIYVTLIHAHPYVLGVAPLP